MRRNMKPMKMVIFPLAVLFVLTICLSCNQEDKYLRSALKAAGNNRPQLEAVLEHYRNNPEKLAAARFLIENMPGHYSYADSTALKYYVAAKKILVSGLSPDEQRDSLRKISEKDYPRIKEKTVQDIEVITSDYLIKNIDKAFKQWKERPWAQHLTFSEFCEYLLPYKFCELQQLDAWRDTLSSHYSDTLKQIGVNDEKSKSAYGALELMRNEIVKKIKPQIRWVFYGGVGGHSLLSAETMPYMTTGSCLEYVTVGSLAFRSVGIPVVMDNVPLWGRNHEGHCWFVLLNDRGMESPARNDITTSPGWFFYPYERFPKVFRSTYAINRDVENYKKEAKCVYPFDLFKKDVTDKYYKTSDIKIPLLKDIEYIDKYVYIAMFRPNSRISWHVLDFGKVKRGKACFKKMGRNMQYIVMGCDGTGLIPISEPFILHKDGSVEMIHFNRGKLRWVTLRRKYYESANVVDMRRRILGGKIQCATRADFSDSLTVFKVDTTLIPDKISLKTKRPYRYWRYLASNGTFGSIAELAFFGTDGTELSGKGIACKKAGQDAIDRAFDKNWLSNFEIDVPDGNWVGMDMAKPTSVTHVRVIPRSDGNDIHPGDEYELRYLDNKSKWCSVGVQTAVGNVLQFKNVPENALLWLIDKTSGSNERPFLMDKKGNIEWW